MIIKCIFFLPESVTNIGVESIPVLVCCIQFHVNYLWEKHKSVFYPTARFLGSLALNGNQSKRRKIVCFQDGPCKNYRIKGLKRHPITRLSHINWTIDFLLFQLFWQKKGFLFQQDFNILSFYFCYFMVFMIGVHFFFFWL